jgi:hypothetical protein
LAKRFRLVQEAREEFWESNSRTTTRIIHKLVLIIPVQEQMLEEDHESVENEDDGGVLPFALEQLGHPGAAHLCVKLWPLQPKGRSSCNLA